MASAADYANWIIANEAKRGTPEFDTVAQAYKQAKASQATAAPPPIIGGTDPTGSFGENLLAGVGKAITDTGRGFQQLGSYVGIGDKAAIQQEIDSAKHYDAALMKTGGGITGDIAGQIGMAVAPGGLAMRAGKAIPMLANAGKAWLMPETLLGGAGVGATQGAVQPVATGDSRMWNTAFGAGGGALVPAAITAGRTVSALAAPFYQGGREKMTGRALERFASNPASIDAAQGARQLVPGSVPTLAEATGDVGLAQLQRSLINNPESNKVLTPRLVENNQARADAVRGIAGDPGQREFFAASRDTAADKLYKQAFAESPELSPWIKGQITQLQKRPAFNNAFDRASVIAANEGIELNPQNAVQVLHWTKKALDGDISAAARSGQSDALPGLMDTKSKLVALIESRNVSPPYREARATYSEMSKPINQMDVGEAFYNKLKPALTDFGPVDRTNAATFAQALRNGDQTAKTATGFQGAKLANILEPQQMQTLTGVAQDLARSTGAAERGRALGSPTLQNTVSRDSLETILKGTGLPRSLVDSGIMETLMAKGGMNWALQPMNERVMGLLGHAATDPKEAKRLLDLARKRGWLDSASEAIPYAAQPGTALGLGLLNLRQ